MYHNMCFKVGNCEDSQVAPFQEYGVFVVLCELRVITEYLAMHYVGIHRFSIDRESNG